VLGPVVLHIPGVHNVQNALAAIATGMELDISFPLIQEALTEFSGIQRRLEIIGEVAGVTVVDDYGHHPTEIDATLRAVRSVWPDRRLVVVFQPHRYSRTQALWQEFCAPLCAADLLLLTEIYAAGERPIPGVSSMLIHQGVQALGHRQAIFNPHREELASQLLRLLQPGDVLLTLGAGDVWKIAEHVIRALKEGEAA
jgi:UDP-N-acetylmuramate--alanine ligase